MEEEFFVNMLYPDIEEFRRLSEKGNLIPVYKEILADTYTPVTAFLKLGGSPSFLLESVEGGEKWARYSFLGSRPAKVIKGRGNRVEVIEGLQSSQCLRNRQPDRLDQEGDIRLPAGRGKGPAEIFRGVGRVYRI